MATTIVPFVAWASIQRRKFATREVFWRAPERIKQDATMITQSRIYNGISAHHYAEAVTQITGEPYVLGAVCHITGGVLDSDYVLYIMGKP